MEPHKCKTPLFPDNVQAEMARRLLSNNLFDNSSCAINNSNSTVYYLFNDLCSLAASAVNSFSVSSSLTAARCERDSHSGYEHKCNLFHFLFCFLIL